MSKHKYNMIVAADDYWCIGKNGTLLDHFPEDMKYFRNITKNKVVVMGRTTQESLPNRLFLKSRINMVLSHNYHGCNTNVDPDGKSYVFYLKDINIIPEFIKTINYTIVNYKNEYSNFNYITDGDVFIIGGGQIYKTFLENDMIDTIYLTKIHHEYNGDTFIPNLFDLGFKVVDKLIPTAINEHGVAYDILVLKK